MIIFTQHSLIKLQQRKISKDAVRKTLNSPDYKFKSHSGRIVSYKKFDNLYLKVIYKKEKEKENIIVITQHWEKKPKLIQ